MLSRATKWVFGLCCSWATASPAMAQQAPPPASLAVGDEAVGAAASRCERVLRADVVAIDQVLIFNRLGAFLPSGMMYALRRDVVPRTGPVLSPGNALLRAGKRPRPLVLRMNVGDCLEVTFTNLLAPERVNDNQPATRNASMMINGLDLVGSIASSGSNVGQNESSLAAPGETRVYRWSAAEEGAHRIHSAGALTGGEGNGGQPTHGLFGVVNVEPRGSVWYRSQLTSAELDLMTRQVDERGRRRIDYEAVYPPGHPFQGLPIAAILRGRRIVHSDLNAIIAGGGSRSQPSGAQGSEPPFREFTIVYHDEVGMVQAFPILEQLFLTQSVRDNMAINYGSGGIGAEIISTGPEPFPPFREAVGPAANCNDCKYEEFFLSSWPLGDPAMVVERAPAPPGRPFAAGQALRALFPDDPSNVHHSYLNDRVKMRVVHGGMAEHHIHHLHAHQWFHLPNGPDSSYLDSQAIGPGSSYTLDIAFNGSGNRNKTPGDAIFHCHFYPHFAQGMWELWRVHDVFEDGTRTLPDAELQQGAPIPALVPLPGVAMAPPPSSEMPGYPFYIPGIAGHRAPHPPLDTVDDGGLPRHVVRAGVVEDGARGPFDRIAVEIDALQLPETGTAAERAAMDFHARRRHPSRTPEGRRADFITNGLPPVPGAPYADPCVDDAGNPVNHGNERAIKGAVIQIDAIINKAGWHFPQTRLSAHWADVDDITSGSRAPEPFFMRALSGDCINFFHTNLLPSVYAEDDFQVFTPTDIAGQHIHLVKFDVTSSDGSGNGWNYEDGTFAPDEVLERIDAINARGGLATPGRRTLLAPRPHPFFGVLGAQTTVQRWWADPILTAQGVDRTVRTVFTHDHFSPSTHQQAGLYAGLLVEPPGSKWRHPETGELLGTRFDGGPTHFAADILTLNPRDSYREFMLEFQDFHLAYTADDRPVNPPGRREIGLPFLFAPPPVPMPEAISADDVGTFSVNYRNEPLALRLRDPDTNQQAAGPAGDPAFAYSSQVERADERLNQQPNFYPPLTRDVRDLDPFTPLLRAYEGDKIEVRVLVGAHEEGHNFTIRGLKWLSDPDDPNSGFRNNQMMGISEHFEMEIPGFGVPGNASQVDLLYQPSAAVDGQWNGTWGLLRAYQGLRSDLLPLPNNRDGRLPGVKAGLDEARVCPYSAPVREYAVSVVAAADALPLGTLVYNEGHGLNDPTALLYVLDEDLDDAGRLTEDAPREPLILRAAAGECVRVRLSNRLRENPDDLDGFNAFPMLVPNFNANQVRPSALVGLHPQLVHFDTRGGAGINIGFNPESTVAPGESRLYTWYAGDISIGPRGVMTARPLEFGATNLISADSLKHSNKGLVGALIVEPEGAVWSFPVEGSRAVADVRHPRGFFRDFVLMEHDDINFRLPDGSALPLSEAQEDPEDSGHKALNYRTEPMWTRLGFAPDATLGETNDVDFTEAFSIEGTGPIETPIFSARAGMPIRLRVLRPAGHLRNGVFTLHGHQWRLQPGNPRSFFVGSQEGVGSGSAMNVLPLGGAGGRFRVTGDYLMMDNSAGLLDGGMWGIVRVQPAR